MATKLALFDAKSYDQTFFDAANAQGEFEIKYVPSRLTPDTAGLADGYDAVCAFVNDDLAAPTVETLYAQGVRLIAMRCAGYNNIDLDACFGRIHVARVPAYSPHAVAEHTVAHEFGEAVVDIDGTVFDAALIDDVVAFDGFDELGTIVDGERGFFAKDIFTCVGGEYGAKGRERHIPLALEISRLGNSPRPEGPKVVNCVGEERQRDDLQER